MQVNIEPTSIEDVIIVKPEIFEDQRGFFTEVYRQDQYDKLGLPNTFAQFNHSGSCRNTVRGVNGGLKSVHYGGVKIVRQW